ncbi:MAG: alpha/beta fold hydrolase [Patescibacteria group bacterium]
MKLSIPRIFFIITCSFFFSSIACADPLPPLRQEMTLDPSVTYEVVGEQYVYSTGIVTIPAGTRLVFAPGAKLTVYGKLTVKGTAKNPVSISVGSMAPLKLERLVVPEQSELSAPLEISAEQREAQTVQVAPLEIVPLPEPQAGMPEVAPLGIAPMAALTAAVQGKHGGIVFLGGSLESSLSYLEINDATVGILVDATASVVASHVTFRNCDTGILNSFGKIDLNSSTFIDTAFPGDISTNAVFTHTDTTFSGTGQKGWSYGGYVQRDTEIRLASKDGAYYIAGLEVAQDATLTFGPGTALVMQDGRGIKVAERATLNINGTELSPVSMYGTGTCNAHEPAIEFRRASIGTIRHASLDKLCGGIKAAETTLSIADSTFKNVEGIAVDVSIQTLLTMTGNDITGSDRALSINQSVIKNVSQNYFHGNASGVSVADMPKAIIKNNGWGSDSGPKIASNPGGTGDTIVVTRVPEVIYRPWLGMKDVPEPPVSEDPDEPVEPPPANLEHNPIIIIPGITGSVLTKDYGDKSELWPNLTKLTLNLADSHLNDLILLQSGTPSTVRPVMVGDIIRKISSIDIFDGLIAALSKNGYVEGTNLFVLPYDWRLSNEANQALLKDMVAKALEKTGKQKVDLVAHSMGGLLVSDYLAKNASAPVSHVFNIAVPHLGAPKSFKTLMYGDDMGFGFSIGSALRVPVLSESRVKTITQNMPAVYELLPSKRYIDIIGSYIEDRTNARPFLSLEGTEAVMAADGRNEKMFPFAKALHDNTDSLDRPWIPTYNFAGCGTTKTVNGFVLTKEQSLTLTGFKLVPEHRIQYGAGDGVVPLKSATAGTGAHNYFVTAGTHGSMPSVSDIQRAMLAVLGGTAVSSSATLADTPASCPVSGTVVEVHSPVSLDIYDQQGRHTGPNDKGEIEYGIPNVQYDVINDEKSAFLPGGLTYKIVNRAESAGVYDMYISQSNGNDMVTQQAYYHAVPLINEKSVGTAILSAVDASPTISFDDTGDGNADRAVLPSSVLQGSQIADAVAPVTKGSVAAGVVSLAATDDNSGILNTKYSTDNVIWKTYDKPFAAAEGSTAYFVSIDKAGNTEEIQEIKVNASAVQTSTGSSSAGLPSAASPATHSSGSLSGGAAPAKNAPIPGPLPSVSQPQALSQAPHPSAQEMTTPIKEPLAEKQEKMYLTAPAPDEGTVMADSEITLKGLTASAGVARALGSKTVMIIGALAVAGAVLYVIFSKKRS